jgi:hypothetical protein
MLLSSLCPSLQASVWWAPLKMESRYPGSTVGEVVLGETWLLAIPTLNFFKPVSCGDGWLSWAGHWLEFDAEDPTRILPVGVSPCILAPLLAVPLLAVL